MEETFTLTWDDATQVVQEEEVICGIDEENLITVSQSAAAAFNDVCEEVIVAAAQPDPTSEGVMYITEDNMLVVQEGSPFVQVAEEVITDQWHEEIVVGSEEHIGEEEDDVMIPLPSDQDQYTAARPYPCDFCSRRFRKKANLMNHMVAHQTDRPHSCNLCGVRYIRKCDLMNHLKIHAYAPETDNNEEEPEADEEGGEYRARRRPKPFVRRRKKKLSTKAEFGFEAEDEQQMALASGSGSRAFGYVHEHEHEEMQVVRISFFFITAVSRLTWLYSQIHNIVHYNSYTVHSPRIILFHQYMFQEQ